MYLHIISLNILFHLLTKIIGGNKAEHSYHYFMNFQNKQSKNEKI